MALGTDQITVTTGANFIPELWGDNVIFATEAQLFFRKLIWDWTTPGKGKGDIIHIPGVSNLTASAKAANTEVVLSAPTEGVTNLNINRHDHVAFLLEDIVKVQASYNLMQFYTQKAGYGLADLMDDRIVTLVASLSQIRGAAGVDLGDVDIRDGIELLDLADAPSEWRYLAIHPTQKNSLFGIEKYFRADFRGDGASQILTKGMFGKIYDL